MHLPNKICTSCALLLRAALKLRTLCLQAEDQLQTLKQEQQEQQKQEQINVDSDCDMSSEFVESYEVTLETASTTDSHCSADFVTIKPSSPVPATVPASKPKRRTAIAVPRSHSNETNKPTGLSYACSICNNVYTEKVKLTAHLKVHSVHKPHECE